MLYEVCAYKENDVIVEANSCREAKSKVCRMRGYKQSDYYHGFDVMGAIRLKVSNTEIMNTKAFSRADVERYLDKDVLIFDQHSGIATKIMRATKASIEHFMNESSIIFIL